MKKNFVYGVSGVLLGLAAGFLANRPTNRNYSIRGEVLATMDIDGDGLDDRIVRVDELYQTAEGLRGGILSIHGDGTTRLLSGPPLKKTDRAVVNPQTDASGRNRYKITYSIDK